MTAFDRSPVYVPRKHAAGPAWQPKCCIPGCDRDGREGLGVALTKGREGQWFCSPHWRERVSRGVAA